MLQVHSESKRHTLCATDWVELKQIKDPNNGINGYEYLHEKQCEGKIIVLFPFRTKNEKTEYLLRKEVTPCWRMTPSISSITGGFEKEKGIKGTAVIELEEEAGYEVSEKDLISLGTCRGTKSTDTVYHIFAVDLTNVEKTTDAAGDGTKLEAEAECEWKKDLDDCEDPTAYVAYVRLQQHNSSTDKTNLLQQAREERKRLQRRAQQATEQIKKEAESTLLTLRLP